MVKKYTRIRLIEDRLKTYKALLVLTLIISFLFVVFLLDLINDLNSFLLFGLGFIALLVSSIISIHEIISLNKELKKGDKK
jgi:hypothetical protein